MILISKKSHKGTYSEFKESGRIILAIAGATFYLAMLAGLRLFCG